MIGVFTYTSLSLTKLVNSIPVGSDLNSIQFYVINVPVSYFKDVLEYGGWIYIQI
jgi:hypothetical protein